MTLKKDPENVFSGKRKIPTAKKVMSLLAFGCLIVLFSAHFLNVSSVPEPVQAAAEPAKTPEAVVPPAPQEKHLPEPVRYVIERIQSYVTGDYLSASFSGRTVRQYVAVKYFEDSDVYRYEMNEKWALARAGDAVICTAYLSKGRVEWTQTLQYAPPQAK